LAKIFDRNRATTYRQRIEQSFVPARSMFPVIRSVHLSIAFKANIAHKKWAIIKYKYMLRATTKDWLRLHLFKQFHKELQLTTWPPLLILFIFLYFPLLQVHDDTVNQHRPAALISVLSSLEMLDNKLDFVQILPSDRSTQWCPSAMMVQIMEVFSFRRNTPRANRGFM